LKTPAAVQGSEDERFVVFRRVRDGIRDYLCKLRNRAAQEVPSATLGIGERAANFWKESRMRKPIVSDMGVWTFAILALSV
jgi:hypothetical protein